MFDPLDPKDHIYGALGLFSGSTKRHDLTVLSLLKPDYSKTVAQIFCDAARFTIQNESQLNTLVDIFHRIDNPEIRDTPSWVSSYNIPWHAEKDAATLAPFTNADDKTRTQVVASTAAEMHILKLKGVRAKFVQDDCVNVVSSVFWREILAVKLLEEIFPLLGRYPRAVYNNDIPEDLGLTLLGGMNAEGTPATQDDCRDIELFLEDLEAGDEISAILNNLQNFAPTPGSRKYRAARFAQGFFRRFGMRRFFIMSSGHIGIGPQTMLPGDVVAVLYGGYVPFVLRPCGEEYELVGECYVHGIMNGEVIRQHKEEGNEDTIFRIR